MQDNSRTAGPTGVHPVIFQLVVHLVRPGTVPGYLQRLADLGRPARERAGARLEGVWTSCSGQLHEVWKLWSYSDAARMRAVNESMPEDPQWQAYMGQPTLAVLLESRRWTLQGQGDLAAALQAPQAAAVMFRLEQPLDQAAPAPAAPGMTLLADPETGHTLLALHPLAAEPAAAGGWPAPPPPQAPQDWGVHQAVRSVYAVTLQRVELARAA